MTDWPIALQCACEQWAVAAAEGRLRPSSTARYVQVFDAFCRFAEESGAFSPEGITAALARRFIDAPLRSGSAPCTATSRLRLTVIRSAFEVLACNGVIQEDPTAELRVPHTAAERAPTPLTPPEATRLLLSGRMNPLDTLSPAASALALLGAMHAEIAGSVVADFCQADAILELGAGRSHRNLPVPPRFVDILRRRVAHQRSTWLRRRHPWDPEAVPLVLNRPASTYPVNSVAPTVSDNLRRALRLAGIQRPGVRPKSLREYAANAIYAKTQRIEAVAEQLGLSSFDTAARLIDARWHERWGEQLRTGGT